MEIPESIKKVTQNLTNRFGDRTVYLGEYEGKQVFKFKLPGNQITGFPIVYLFDPSSQNVQRINGIEIFSVLNKLEKTDEKK